MSWQDVINFGERVRPVADAVGLALVPVVFIMAVVLLVVGYWRHDRNSIR